MSVLHIWAIFAGIAALGLPLAIHFFTRPKPVRLPLSTIRFVQQAVQQRRARHRLRDWVILMLRTLAIALLALTFSRPLFDGRAASVVDDSVDHHRIVLVDVSQSMAEIDHGVVAMDRAKVVAARELAGFNKHANLILAGAQPKAVFDTPSRNLKALREALASARPQPERINVDAALELASQMLSRSDEEAKLELVIVSDFQRTNWASAKFETLPENCEIRLESVAPEADSANFGIVDVRFGDRATVGGLSQLEIEIRNFSSEPRKISCAVELDDAAFVVDSFCPARDRTVVSHPIEIRTAGWKIGSVQILDHQDALREDDHFAFALETVANDEIKLVTRTRSVSEHNSDYFIERAISPFADERVVGEPTISRLLPNRLDPQSVGNSQLLIFDQPGKLENEQIELMASLLRRGRNILYFASELIDANNLKLLYQAVGSDLQAPVEFVPGTESSVRRNLKIATVQQSRRPFSVFGETVEASLSSLQFSGGLESRPLAGAIEEEVLARLSDGSALVFISRAGAGNLCVFNADLNRSNFVQHPTFVPVLNELVDVMLQSSGRRQPAYCGEPITRLLPTDIDQTDGLTIQPDDVGGSFRRSGQGVVWSASSPGGPGVAEIRQSDALVYAATIQIPPEESDLRYLDGEILTDRLAGQRKVDFHRVQQPHATLDHGWVWCAVIVVMLMIGEVVCLNFFRV